MSSLKKIAALILIILLIKTSHMKEITLIRIVNNYNIIENEDFLIDVPISINIQNESQFLVPIDIGTPPQRFYPVIDTGSSILWVHGETCQICSKNLNLFNPSKSSSFIDINIFQFKDIIAQKK